MSIAIVIFSNTVSSSLQHLAFTLPLKVQKLLSLLIKIDVQGKSGGIEPCEYTKGYAEEDQPYWPQEHLQ